MKVNNLLLGLCALLASCQSAPKANEYVVIAGNSVVADSAWNKVAQTLKDKHQAAFLTYQTKPEEVLPQLQQIRPRYVAIVEKPENLGRDYVIALNQMSRKVDSDVYADFLWGIITGYDAAAAMKMVNNSTEPLVLKDAIATITELSSGKWFDRFAWLDDHKMGLWGEKASKDDTIVSYQLPMKKMKLRYTMSHGNYRDIERMMVDPKDAMQTFYDFYEKYNPDLVVTAAHATERNLEMPFSLGNIKPKNGVLYMDFPDGPKDLKESGKRRVYLPIGNCLIANMKNTKDCMAAAWMNSANAATMVGYVVTTWHGRNGWGGLKYLVTNPGRYSVAEAFFMNQQDFVHQLNAWNPKFMTMQYPYDSQNEFAEAPQLIMDSIGIQPTKDQVGFFHDRDVLAYYGDPKWNVRLQEIPEETDFTVASEVKGKKCIITITTKENFSLERMKGDKFKQEHVLDLPFSYFFPQRLNNPRLAAGQNWNVALDENFLLVYNADFEPGKTYTVELDID
ncbi:MAG: hypothetical protein MR298_03265 [Odoribacter sp.]|nr:hypothetical protein [Odoribacter sp.]MDY3034558.1 hypothetical protein [Odoribacter sp.]